MKIVTAGIILYKNRVLIMRRASSEKFAGCWEFPGGKLEDKETPEACLARELKEELHIEVRVKELFCESTYDYPQGRIHLFAYFVEVLAGDIQLTVHDQLKWVDKENLLHFALLPADVPIAEKIVEEIL